MAEDCCSSGCSFPKVCRCSFPSLGRFGDIHLSHVVPGHWHAIEADSAICARVPMGRIFVTVQGHLAERAHEPQNIQQGTAEFRRKEDRNRTVFTSPFGVPCWIFCGSLPVRSPFPVNAYGFSNAPSPVRRHARRNAGPSRMDGLGSPWLPTFLDRWATAVRGPFMALRGRRPY